MKYIAEAFTYQFEDKDWVKKFLLGSLFVALSFFLIPMPFLMGYIIRNIRNILKKQPNPLPEWNELGKMYVDGLKFFIYCLGYALPVVLIIVVIAIMVIVMAVAGNDDMAVFFGLLMFPMQLLIMVYSLLMMLVSPVLYIKFANNEPAKNFYNLKQLYKFIKDNIANLLIVILLNAATGFIVNIGMLFFFIGILPALYYAFSVISHLYGQLYLQAKK